MLFDKGWSWRVSPRRWPSSRDCEEGKTESLQVHGGGTRGRGVSKGKGPEVRARGWIPGREAGELWSERQLSRSCRGPGWGGGWL